MSARGFRTMRLLAATGALAFAIMGSGGMAAPARVMRAPTPAVLNPLSMRVVGRVASAKDAPTDLRRQWPGTYFETAFRGTAAYFRVGPGDVILHVSVDGERIDTLVKPAAGLYLVDGLPQGKHRLRIAVASESQAAPTTFSGFFLGQTGRGAALPVQRRQIEFVGDSHTVGYADTSAKQTCTEDEVWAATDTTKAFSAILAEKYHAEYQVNAISGRGVVRNYNGFSADTLPEAYPFALLNHELRVDAAGWTPQLIVIALGTNDFSTALHEGEKWHTREALHADFEASYVRFIQSLRARNPRAFILMWATDKADGEIEAEAQKVMARLRTAGETRIAYVPIDGLSFSACHSHPSLADEERISRRLATAIDRHEEMWREGSR